MKKSKSLKKLKKDFKAFNKSVSNYTDLIKSEYESNYNKSIDSLLKKIAEGESLDYNYLKEKYVLKGQDDLDNIMLEEEDNSLDLFDKVVIDEKSYFYENKEGGKIYDDKAVEVGFYKNNNFVLNSQ
jgi:hypothetical protein